MVACLDIFKAKIKKKKKTIAGIITYVHDNHSQSSVLSHEISTPGILKLRYTYESGQQN